MAMAMAAGIGQVVRVRVKKGEQSPRFGTLAAVRGAGDGCGELVAGEE